MRVKRHWHDETVCFQCNQIRFWTHSDSCIDPAKSAHSYSRVWHSVKSHWECCFSFTVSSARCAWICLLGLKVVLLIKTLELRRGTWWTVTAALGGLGPLTVCLSACLMQHWMHAGHSYNLRPLSIQWHGCMPIISFLILMGHSV